MPSLLEDDTRNMVLRTVFIPPNLDDALRDAAFSQGVNTGQLLRSIIANALSDYVHEDTPDIARSKIRRSNPVAKSAKNSQQKKQVPLKS